MKTKRRAVKKGAGHAAKRTQARRAGRPARRRKGWITPAQARRLAARHVMPAMFDGAPVRDGADVRWGFYNMRRKDVWVVFPQVERALSTVCPSSAVVVCKRTGRVLYAGSAMDEG